MKKTLSKTAAEKQIEDFFLKIQEKIPKEIKKIKKFAMSYNIKLEEKRKLFCKKCFNPYTEPSIHVKNGFVNITCDKCEHKSRWKLE